MTSQPLSIEVRGAAALLSHTSTWAPELDAPECTIEMPSDSTIALRVANVGKIAIDGDLEFDPIASGDGLRILRWTAAAKAAEHGSCTVTLSHPNDDFSDVEISVDMSEEASLHVEEEEPPKVVPPLTNIDVINRYGAYACVVLASLGTLLFALLMPAHRTELVSGAAAIGIWGYFSTSIYDRFVWRILGFVAAGVTMGFAMAMPDQTNSLIEGAGGLCALAIWFGDN